MAIFLHRLPYRKNAIHFLTMAIFSYGNFPRDQTDLSGSVGAFEALYMNFCISYVFCICMKVFACICVVRVCICASV